ncbi:hypothetical protein PG990_004260 [Apiospora arundinis]
MSPKRRYILGVAGIALLFLVSLKALSERRPGSGYSSSPALFAPSRPDLVSGKDDHRIKALSLALPAEYSAASLLNLSEPLSDFCRDRFGTQFVEKFSRCRARYCSEDSGSDITCFHTANPGSGLPGGSKDSLCLIRDGVSFDVDRRKFTFDCQLQKDPSSPGGKACAVPYRDITSYGYLTGAKYILNEWMSLKKTIPSASSEGTPRHGMVQSDTTVVLLKREVDGNIWHCMNEIMALMTTFDVLRVTPRSDAGGAAALFSPEARSKTEIIILDDLPDGTYFDLFQMFSASKPKRLDEWIASKRTAGKTTTESVIPSIGNVIVPLAGSANPLWSDWKPIECTDNTMLRVFVQRIFDFYGIPRTRKRTDSKIQVNLIVRKGSRQLMGLDTYLVAALRAKFGGVTDVHLIDFEGMSFREQVETARDTDVLVGMHGAGLTHAMFMEEGRGALVEIQPDRLCHWGFRNVAKMTGHAYFVAGASKIVGNCYPVPEDLRRADDAEAGVEGKGKGETLYEVLPDDGKGAAYDPSRCYTHTTDAAAWSLACSDPKVTGGERSFWTCRNRDADDAWYQTCKKKEAADIWWMTRYIMEQDRFVKLVGDAIETVRRAEERSR